MALKGDGMSRDGENEKKRNEMKGGERVKDVVGRQIRVGVKND